MRFPFGNKIKFVTVRQDSFNKKGAELYIGLPADREYELLKNQPSDTDKDSHLVYLAGFKHGSKGLLIGIHKDDLKQATEDQRQAATIYPGLRYKAGTGQDG
jgi:predicted N-formylglutamate amidohydrolase